MLAYSTDTSALDRIVAEDPFVLHQLVDVGVRRFEPALRAPGFLAVLNEARPVECDARQSS